MSHISKSLVQDIAPLLEEPSLEGWNLVRFKSVKLPVEADSDHHESIPVKADSLRIFHVTTSACACGVVAKCLVSLAGETRDSD